MGAERKIPDDDSIIEFIVKHQAEYGAPPPLTVMATEFGVSKSAVMNAMTRLLEAGRVRKAPRVPRGIYIPAKMETERL